MIQRTLTKKRGDQTTHAEISDNIEISIIYTEYKDTGKETENTVETETQRIRRCYTYIGVYTEKQC